MEIAGWQKVTTFFDADVVDNWINSKSPVAAIDFKEMVLELQSSSVVFVKRDLYVVAHSLVKLSILAGTGSRTWLGVGTTQSNTQTILV